MFRLRKEFPYHNPREAFDAVKSTRRRRDKKDHLTRDDIARLMRELNPNYTNAEILDVISAIDLTESGDIAFDEFEKVFIANIKTSASI